MELDLASLRKRLDRAAERMMLRLKDRTYFPQNLRIYQRGAMEIRDAPNLSLCEYALRELERYQARLGRFRFRDQVPLIYVPRGDESPVLRESLMSP